MTRGRTTDYASDPSCSKTRSPSPSGEVADRGTGKVCCTLSFSGNLQIALASGFGSGIFMVDLFGPFRYQLSIILDDKINFLRPEWCHTLQNRDSTLPYSSDRSQYSTPLLSVSKGVGRVVQNTELGEVVFFERAPFARIAVTVRFQSPLGVKSCTFTNKFLVPSSRWGHILPIPPLPASHGACSLVPAGLCLPVVARGIPLSGLLPSLIGQGEEAHISDRANHRSHVFSTLDPVSQRVKRRKIDLCRPRHVSPRSEYTAFGWNHPQLILVPG